MLQKIKKIRITITSNVPAVKADEIMLGLQSGKCKKIPGKDSITDLLKDSREFNKRLAKRMLLQNQPRKNNSTLYKKEMINIL